MVKSQKRNRKSKKSRRNNPIFSRIDQKMYGGSEFGLASLNNSIRNPYIMYSQNSYANDPSWPNAGNLSARNILGGRKRLRRLNRKSRRLRGGNPNGYLGTTPPITSTPLFSFGSFLGDSTGASILNNRAIPLGGTTYANDNFVRAIV
jgi:hypothetical protein